MLSSNGVLFIGICFFFLKVPFCSLEISHSFLRAVHFLPGFLHCFMAIPPKFIRNSLQLPGNLWQFFQDSHFAFLGFSHSFLRNQFSFLRISHNFSMSSLSFSKTFPCFSRHFPHLSRNFLPLWISHCSLGTSVSFEVYPPGGGTVSRAVPCCLCCCVLWRAKCYSHLSSGVLFCHLCQILSLLCWPTWSSCFKLFYKATGKAQ